MKVFVAGATGRVAEFLIKDLVAEGHSVLAGARSPECVAKIPNVEAVTMDLRASVEELAGLLAGADVVYFTAGSRGEDLLQTDAFGAVKLAQAAEKAGIKRFIMLSSLNATDPSQWDIYYKFGHVDYIIAKYFADSYLIHQTHLDYTILQPTSLVEADEADGKVSLNVLSSKQNTIPNVARVLAALIEADNSIGKIITMSDGLQPISEAVADII